MAIIHLPTELSTESSLRCISDSDIFHTVVCCMKLLSFTSCSLFIILSCPFNLCFRLQESLRVRLKGRWDMKILFISYLQRRTSHPSLVSSTGTCCTLNIFLERLGLLFIAMEIKRVCWICPSVTLTNSGLLPCRMPYSWCV